MKFLRSVINLKNTISIEEKNELIVFSSNEMLILVSNILDVKKYKEVKIKLQKTNFDISTIWQLVSKQMTYLIKQKNIQIINNINHEIILHADKELITRIFTNLLSNALKYSNNNSKIELLYELTESRDVKLRIKDNGVGIPSEDLPLIFKKYKQVSTNRKEYSTGLGLTFCNFAVELHGGKIGIESQINKGTCVWLYLPKTKIRKKKQNTNSYLTKATLTKQEISELIKYKKLLQETNIHETTALRKIISDIKNNTSTNKKWLAELNNSIFTCNEKHFKEIINLIKI